LSSIKINHNCSEHDLEKALDVVQTALSKAKNKEPSFDFHNAAEKKLVYDVEAAYTKMMESLGKEIARILGEK
jgi:hypothetical protein